MKCWSPFWTDSLVAQGKIELKRLLQIRSQTCWTCLQKIKGAVQKKSTCSLWDVLIDKWRLNKNWCEAVNDSCRKCSFISQWIWKCGRHTLLAAGSLFTSVEQLQNVHYIFIHLYTTLWSVSSSIEDIFPHSDLYSFVKTGPWCVIGCLAAFWFDVKPWKIKLSAVV